MNLASQKVLQLLTIVPDATGDSVPFMKGFKQVHTAVRSLLGKMGIRIIESKFSGTKSICCGDNFYGHIPLDEVHKFQKMRASQMPCQNVAVYCVSCIKAMTIGGKTARYMADLLLGEETDPQENDLKIYHNVVEEYIKTH